MKKLILLLVILQGSIIFAQNSFDNKKLALLDDIYYKTTKSGIDSFMKKNGFEKDEVKKVNDGNLKEIYSFSSNLEDIDVHYSKDNKVLGIYCVYNGAPNNIFIEMEIENKGFKSKIIKQDMDGETISKKVWSKTGSKFTIVTLSLEKEKVGMLNYEISEY